MYLNHGRSIVNNNRLNILEVWHFLLYMWWNLGKWGNVEYKCKHPQNTQNILVSVVLLFLRTILIISLVNLRLVAKYTRFPNNLFVLCIQNFNFEPYLFILVKPLELNYWWGDWITCLRSWHQISLSAFVHQENFIFQLKLNIYKRWNIPWSMLFRDDMFSWRVGKI